MTVTRSFTLTVPGHPIPQGSKTVAMAGNGRPFVRDDNPRLKPWRQRIIDTARFEISDTHRGRWQPLTGPLSVEAAFYLPRPAGHFGTGRNADVVKDSAPAYPIARQSGDVDKLARAALDALTQAGVIEDDVLVVNLSARKRYGQHPGLHLSVMSVPETEATQRAETVTVDQLALL